MMDLRTKVLTGAESLDLDKHMSMIPPGAADEVRRSALIGLYYAFGRLDEGYTPRYESHAIKFQLAYWHHVLCAARENRGHKAVQSAWDYWNSTGEIPR